MRDVEIGDQIDDKFSKNVHGNVYLGKRKGEDVLVKVERADSSNTMRAGTMMAREAGTFNIIKTFSEEVAVLEKKTGDGTSARHDLLFARLEESFLEPTQGFRRFNVFSTPEVELKKLTTLSRLLQTTEIDARSSVWVLGKLFKMYSFFELLATSTESKTADYPLFDPADYLIGPERHRVIYYNFRGNTSEVFAYYLVKQITHVMLNWVKVEDDNPRDAEYLTILEDLAEHGRQRFETAHRDLYTKVRELWGIEYYPFTYREKDARIWKKFGEE